MKNIIAKEVSWIKVSFSVIDTNFSRIDDYNFIYSEDFKIDLTAKEIKKMVKDYFDSFTYNSNVTIYSVEVGPFKQSYIVNYFLDNFFPDKKYKTSEKHSQ